MKNLPAAVFAAMALAIAPATAKKPAGPPIEVGVTHGGDTREMQTRAQLLRLVAAYDVKSWLYTRKIVIESGAIPHSDPVLTLNTRHIRDDELLLSTFMHEELHWFVGAHLDAANEAISELKVLFPMAPADFPEGSGDQEGTYLHLVVCMLEYQVDRQLLGDLKARQIMEFLASDHYTWVYRMILDHGREIRTVLKNHALMPEGTFF